MIAGTGVDIVEVERVERALQEHGMTCLRGLVTEHEMGAGRGGPREGEKYAARFAGKEAALKALRGEWQNGVRFRELEVVTNDMGAPSIRMSGRAREIAESRGITRLMVSMSHERRYAVGQVLAAAGRG